jgi:hypothetical protein
LDPATQAAQILERKANDTAYALLTISIKDETGFQAARNGVTTTLPSGSAREAWKNIIRIYQRKSRTQEYELEHIKVLLKENHTDTISADKTIQHLVYNLKPKCYDTVVFTPKREIQYKHATNPLDLERFKDEIRQVYGQLKNGKTPETALVDGKAGKSTRKIAESVGLKVIKQLIAGKMTRARTKGQHGGKYKEIRQNSKGC